MSDPANAILLLPLIAVLLVAAIWVRESQDKTPPTA